MLTWCYSNIIATDWLLLYQLFSSGELYGLLTWSQSRDVVIYG